MGVCRIIGERGRWLAPWLLLACAGHVEVLPSSSTSGAAGRTSGAAGASTPTEPASGGAPSSVGGAPSSVGGAPSSAGTYPGGGPSQGGYAGTLVGGSAGVGDNACITETKGAACTSEGASCYKTCGPLSVGRKPETCVAGVFLEGTCAFDCTDPTVNWACFGDLATAPACADNTQANTPCTAAPCAPCSGAYLSSSGVQLAGACVCAGVAGQEKWSCANSTAWPACQWRLKL